MAGNFAASRLSTRYGIDRMIWWGIGFEVAGRRAGGDRSRCSRCTGARSIVFGPQLIVNFGNGLLLPGAIAGAVSVRPQAAGTAAGIIGFTQMALGAAFVQLGGLVLVDAATVLPMALLARRRRGRVCPVVVRPGAAAAVRGVKMAPRCGCRLARRVAKNVISVKMSGAGARHVPRQAVWNFSKTNPYLGDAAAGETLRPMNYGAFFSDALARLRDERRYRVFADLERIAGRFPHALWHSPTGRATS